MSGPQGDSVEVPLGEVFPPQVSRPPWGLLQLNRGGEMHREDLLSPGNLASGSAVTLEEFWPKETAGLGWEARGLKAGLSPPPHMVLGWELPWEPGCPPGPTELSPGPLQTTGSRGCFLVRVCSYPLL